ncbi:MAG: segregation and condensation protein B [Acidimicrobiales bacterium]|jgi:segregation and condensation protein B
MSEHMDASDIKAGMEAILMVADQPVAPQQFAELMGVTKEDVEIGAADLIQSYASQGRGFVLQRVAGGLRFQSHPDQASIVERFVLDGQASRLSAAALETMAIIAYKQPISRNQISAIRGVNAEGVVRTLEARGYVDELARDPGPGRASLYGTTDAFLERLGLNSIDELPPLGQFVPGADVVEALENTLMVNPDTSADAAAAELDDSAFDVAAMAAAALADDYGEDRADNDDAEDAGTNDPRVEGADGDDFQALNNLGSSNSDLSEEA